MIMVLRIQVFKYSRETTYRPTQESARSETDIKIKMCIVPTKAADDLWPFSKPCGRQGQAIPQLMPPLLPLRG